VERNKSWLAIIGPFLWTYMNNFEQQIDFVTESLSRVALRRYTHSYAEALNFKTVTATRNSLISYPTGVAKSDYSDKFIRVDAF
jgi:hypothetical protein